jgi:glycosyltransferase involved in cell wall biosynthesis
VRNHDAAKKLMTSAQIDTRDVAGWEECCREITALLSDARSIDGVSILPSCSSAADVKSRCAQVLLYEVIGQLSSLTSDRRRRWAGELVEFISSKSPVMSDADGTIGTALCALDALLDDDAQAMTALERMVTSTGAVAFDWADPLSAASACRAQAATLVIGADRLGDTTAVERMLLLLRALESKQDRQTGLWGAGAGPAIRSAITATAAMLPFFNYVNRPVLRTARMVDTVLTWIASPESETPWSAEECVAIVEILCTSLGHSSHRVAEIGAALTGMQRDMLAELRSALPTITDAVRFPDWFQVWLYLSAWIRIAYSTSNDCALTELRPPDRPGPGFQRRGSRLTDRQRQFAPLWLSGAGPMPPRVVSSPQAAVVIPCFNLGRYLPDALQSVVRQSVPDIEVIVVDDGSDDEFTRVALAEWERSGLTVIRQANSGLAAARNAGVARARSEYVCCLDADDRLAPDFMRRSIALLQQDSQVGFVNVAMQWFDERDDLIPAFPCVVPDMLVQNRAVVGSLFRRSAWESIGGYYGGFSVAGVEDWDFWIRLLVAGYRAAVVEEPLYEYRVRAGSMSQQMYEPHKWRELTGEFAARHRSVFEQHLEAVVGAMSSRHAEVREWAVSRESAIAWWQSKAVEWQRVAEERERTIFELRGWIDELQIAKDWNDEQRRVWETRARRLEATE